MNAAYWTLPICVVPRIIMGLETHKIRMDNPKGMTSMTKSRLQLLVYGMFLMLVTVGAQAQEQYQLKQDQWVATQTPAPGSPEAQLQAIRKMVAQNQGKEAQKAAKDWIKANPNHPMLAEAYLVSGDAKVLQRHYYKALFDYEYMIRTFPGSEHYHLALEREFEVANIFASGTKRIWLGMRMLSAYGEAEELFIRVQERAPGSLIGEKASLELGDFYFKRGEMRSAAEAYQLFLENYPRSRYRERVMLRRIEADLASFNSPVFDPTGLLDASIHIRQFEEEFPASAERLGTQALLVRVNDSLAAKDLHTAQWYEKRKKDNVSAVYMYKRIVKDHPQTAAARDAEIALARLEPTLAGGADK